VSLLNQEQESVRRFEPIQHPQLSIPKGVVDKQEEAWVKARWVKNPVEHSTIFSQGSEKK